MDAWQVVVAVGTCAAAAYLILFVVSVAAHPFRSAVLQLHEIFARPFVWNAEQVDTNVRWRRIDSEIDREIGLADPWGRQERADVIQAAVDAQRITLLDQKFRASIRTCLRTHWKVAEGLGASHMSEAARHPLCAQLRQRVIDVAEVLSETIENYPLIFESPELVRLHVGLHRIAPTCIACPYWTTSVAAAPRLCPPARAVGCDTQPGNAVMNAEIVNGD